jgi:phage gpG-like protein
MLGIEVQSALKEFGLAMRNLDRKLDAVTKLWIVQAAFMIENSAKKKVSETVNKRVKIPGLMRSGLLLNSISSSFDYKNGRAEALIGPRNVIYARMREYGGVVRPKKAKRLFIPISRKGQRIGPQRDKSKRGDLKMGVDFVLAKQAVIPARPYMRPAYFNNQDKMIELLLDMIAKRLLG